MHFKPGAKYNGKDMPDLVYDDLTPYVTLVKTIRKQPWYNEVSLFSNIFHIIREYLPNDDTGLGRAMTYLASNAERVSIKTIRENQCAFCSENAGLAHNLLKFLGVDSEFASGYRDSERHAYNIIYPCGYDKEPIIIYDPSFYVKFSKGDSAIACGYYKSFKKDEFQKMLDGEPLKINLARTEQVYRQLYALDDNYEFEGDEPSYILGLDNYKETLNEVPESSSPKM